MAGVGWVGPEESWVGGDCTSPESQSQMLSTRRGCGAGSFAGAERGHSLAPKQLQVLDRVLSATAAASPLCLQ